MLKGENLVLNSETGSGKTLGKKSLYLYWLLTEKPVFLGKYRLSSLRIEILSENSNTNANKAVISKRETGYWFLIQSALLKMLTYELLEEFRYFQ